ncbi:hypothetical protein [Roseateles depolymerans]|uniref:Uncharacterized protein n=1 Tax=Roseateles depolymerans TaxID=76731 RepID=A0A0U3NEH7_9BURK|nr:hypothetical protein [Roseateles depolymerans]ALV06832.1 hypothetical protein RD2015_2361 [Roseateles depolymerans]REG19810.1 hypothetical protein DES44_2316 [Roseateles depolymerans]
MSPRTPCGSGRRQGLSGAQRGVNAPPPKIARPQRGAATLLMCSLLLMLLALAVLWSARPLAAAQRIAANDHRSTAAVQAADAGLAWAAAMLNTGRVDDNCRPAFDAGLDFRSRVLKSDTSGSPVARSSTSWVAACTHNGSLRWSCRCDGQVPASASSTAGPGLETTFAIRVTDADVPGQFILLARGCSGAPPTCAVSDLPPPDGTGLAEHSQHLALLSALRRPPSTGLIEGGQVASQNQPNQPKQTSPAFVRVFGFPSSQYRLQPALTRLACGDHCGPELRQALSRGRRLIWIDGNVTLREALPPPSDGQPLVLLVDGQLDIETAQSFSGLIYARSDVRWASPTGSSSVVRGALVTDGRLIRTGDAGTLQLEWDEALLRRIQWEMGSYLPVPGGWSNSR